MAYNYPGAMPNYYQPNYYQGYQAPQTPQYQQGSSGIIWVGSELEAANYLMAPNSAVALWDSNSPCIYFKQTDASGKPTMDVYDLVKRSPMTATASAALNAFVTRKEFDALTARIDALTSKEADNE